LLQIDNAMNFTKHLLIATVILIVFIAWYFFFYLDKEPQREVLEQGGDSYQRLLKTYHNCVTLNS
jgi:hypothetical protein